MRVHSVNTALSISSLISLSTAWPVLPNLLERRQPVSYSVVAVDGGNSGSDGSATTVTDSIVHTETILHTQLSTIIITESETPTTIVVTVTSAVPTTITEQAEPATLIQTVTFAPETTAEPSQPSPETTVQPSRSRRPESSSSPPPPPPAPETVTVTQYAPSSRKYDDGMWHTDYYFEVPAEPETSSSTDASSVTTTETRSFHPTTTPWSAWQGPTTESSSSSTASSTLPSETQPLESSTTTYLGLWDQDATVSSSAPGLSTTSVHDVDGDSYYVPTTTTTTSYPAWTDTALESTSSPSTSTTTSTFEFDSGFYTPWSSKAVDAPSTTSSAELIYSSTSTVWSSQFWGAPLSNDGSVQSSVTPVVTIEFGGIPTTTSEPFAAVTSS
ncbi:hypothetical protein PV10_03954 [Exophiala mesophila]|uniref:Uncharacterized protein n=1 Tax=Exophiala mesophila TaxID=212818 RepID=A0A0D1XWS9_EXOME|nr:uncharacterized protein PV10_03954 [Exophiala mesophila]KIV92681.1 hypothetical protein PV10_03954 [Exophiala mesophila]